jgi:hypothetical protein
LTEESATAPSLGARDPSLNDEIMKAKVEIAMTKVKTEDLEALSFVAGGAGL